MCVCVCVWVGGCVCGCVDVCVKFVLVCCCLCVKCVGDVYDVYVCVYDFICFQIIYVFRHKIFNSYV